MRAKLPPPQVPRYEELQHVLIEDLDDAKLFRAIQTIDGSSGDRQGVCGEPLQRLRETLHAIAYFLHIALLLEESDDKDTRRRKTR
ncbi:hypothetical protein P43SY_006448 [Pythium insidiosum]|uniref:Uncharacterized protein n=1 Tax=Pythium insidiosum TaxID=114742 RepID=A0AAD5QA89_PYTIN|nr:hypothetical protein P43SY_006448 [Pythium insidiosum]